jgi:hypothetical protein
VLELRDWTSVARYASAEGPLEPVTERELLEVANEIAQALDEEYRHGSCNGSGATAVPAHETLRAGQMRIADTGLIFAARRAGSQLAASTATKSTAAVVASVIGS